MSKSFTGYAVKDCDTNEIDVRTVSPTPRGVHVNWLVAGPPRMKIWDNNSDSSILGWFQHYAAIHNVACVKVSIQEVLS